MAKRAKRAAAEAGAGVGGRKKRRRKEAPLHVPLWRGAAPGDAPEGVVEEQRRALGIEVSGSPAPPPVESLEDEGLPAEFAKFFAGARGSKVHKPTPIQMQVWPAALYGLDVLGIAPTGSGKTLSYLLPAVPHILSQPGYSEERQSPICLVLLPTRELASQVSEQCHGSGGLQQLFGLRAEAIYGGVERDSQVDAVLKPGAPQVLAATPGRLLDLLKSSALSLSGVSFLVLDEADRMLALGFEQQLDELAQAMRAGRQTLLFSATFPRRLQQAAERWLSPGHVLIRVAAMELGSGAREAPKASEVVENAPDGTASAAAGSLTVNPLVTHTLHVCAEHKKPRKLLRFLQKVREDEKKSGARQRSLVIIFCNKIKTLKFVVGLLEQQWYWCASLHSGIPQAQREKTLADFKAGRTPTLVATDVAARGLHIKHVKYVINYDFPSNLEQYCHRIGRTGREGEEGTAFSFFTRKLAPLAPDLTALLERSGAWVDPNLRELVNTTQSDEKADDSESCDEKASEEHSSPRGGASDSESFASAASGVGRGGGLRIRPRKRRGSGSSGSEAEGQEAPEAAAAGEAATPLAGEDGGPKRKQKKGGRARKTRRDQGARGR